MKGRSKKYYRKIFRAYPDMVTLLQFREMLSGVSDNFARKLIHEKHVKSIFIKPHYYISKNSVIDYVLSEDYAKRKVRDHVLGNILSTVYATSAKSNFANWLMFGRQTS